MERLRDISVLDFCIWLSEIVWHDCSKANEHTCLPSNLFPQQVRHYAEMYLSQFQVGSNDYNRALNSLVTGFLSSDQYKKYLAYVNQGLIEDISFIEWTLNREKDISFDTMPSIIFDELIEEYSRCVNVEPKDIVVLKHHYYCTGWSDIFEKIKQCFTFRWARPQRNLAYVMDRYLSHRAKYNCVVLPLADKESKKQFSKLIKDEWKNLHDLSGNELDIFFCETDIGKTGYDIAKRLRSLPESLRKTAPSIILWKDAIKQAKAISTDGLDAVQIRNTIKTIVQQIQEGNDLETIIQEAEKTVKKQEAMNNGVTYNEFSGGKNVVVMGNTGNTFVNQGGSAKFGDISMGNTVNKNTCEFLHELEEAIFSIKNSNEIEAESKEQLISIMEDAKQAEIENSDEKRSMAKKAFGYVKGFLVKSAPVLISTLANLTKIAGFFGLSV